MKKAFIIDIDNCWLDSRLWISKAPLGSTSEDEWMIFYRKVYFCKPNKEFIEDILKIVEEKQLFPIFVTARSGSVATQTILQIQQNSPLIVGNTCALYMRPSRNDYRSSEEVKRDLLMDVLKEYEIECAIDDTVANLLMFKEHGISNVIHYDIQTHDYNRI